MTQSNRILRIVLAGMLLCMLLLLPASRAGAVPTDRFVANAGSDTTNDCSNPLTASQTIWHAISESSSGDSIYIKMGMYPENLAISIDLKLFGDGMYATIVDGGGLGRVLSIGTSVTVELHKMTIQNADYSGDGGGIANDVGSTLNLDHVNVTNNTAGGSGGGIATYGPLNIVDSVLSWNEAGAACRASGST